MKKLKLYSIEFIHYQKALKKRLTDQGKSESNCTILPNRLLEFFYFLEQREITSVNKINQKAILDYYDYLKKRPHIHTGQPITERYISKHSEAVLRFMEMLHNKPKGKSGYYFPLKYVERKDVEVFTISEIEQIYATTDNTLYGITNRVILSLLYGCGLRKGELHTLELNDINFSQNEIRLRNTKNGYERDVPMSPTVVKYLEEYLYNARNFLLPESINETRVLIDLRGKAMTHRTIYQRVQKMIWETGIKKQASPHILRHSIGTHLVDYLSIQEIADFLGHRTINSTQQYIHLNEILK